MQPSLSFIKNITLGALIMALALIGPQPMKNTFVFDMHYGPLIGLGWTASDWGNVSVATITADVTAGSYAIPVSGNFGLNVGILAVYQASDGDWYSFRIRSSSASQILSDRPLQAITTGAKVGNAYVNDAHPNVNGGAAIADAFLRQIADPVLGRAREVEKVMRGVDAWPAGTFSSVSDYAFPGADGAGYQAATFTSTGAASYTSAVTPLMGGDYIVKIPLNTGLASGLKNTVTITVEEQTGAAWTAIGSKAFEGYSATYLAEVPFTTDGTKQVRIKASVGAASSFYIGQIEFDRIVGPAIDINSGKVVLLTDSWGTSTAPITQRLAARLTSATVVSKGVGGQRSDQLLARFDTDVTPENPDTVIVIVGTNDYYASVTPPVFETNISAIKAKIGAIHAQAVVFTPSVGAITYTPPQMFPSRTYESYVRFLDYADPWPSFSAPWRFVSCFVQDCEVGAGESKTVFRSPGAVKTTQYLPYLSMDNPALSVNVGFSGGVDLSDSLDLPSGITRKRWLRRGPTATPGEIVVEVVNDTVNPQTFTLSAEIAWKGDLS